MSKLLKLKEWLTLEEAASHLSSVLGEVVSVKDLLRLALDKHLCLSVNFVNKTHGKLGRIIDFEEVEFFEMEMPEYLVKMNPLLKGKILKSPKDLSISTEEYLRIEDKVWTIDGIWDLMMIGGESLDIEHLYQRLTGGPEITLETLDGSFVRQGDKVCQLMESFDNNEFQVGSKAIGEKLEAYIVENKVPSKKAKQLRDEYKKDREKYLKQRSERDRSLDYFPAGGLPEDGVLVVRTRELLTFLQSIDGKFTDKDKPLGSKERNTYLILIAALCKQAAIDYNQRGVAAAIERATEEIGAPISDDTIRRILSQIQEALDLRIK